MRKAIFLITFILLIAFSFAAFFFFYETRYFVGRASVSQASFSINNSYLFVTPIKAAANGEERIRVTVFVLNNQGLGVLGKRVGIATDPNIIIDEIQGSTDAYGKALFDISSSQPGDYYLEVNIDNEKLLQKAHLSFY